jgi:hypothetical protein
MVDGTVADDLGTKLTGLDCFPDARVNVKATKNATHNLLENRNMKERLNQMESIGDFFYGISFLPEHTKIWNEMGGVMKKTKNGKSLGVKLSRCRGNWIQILPIT